MAEKVLVDRRMELKDKADLERFFTELTQDDAPGGSYRDLDFEVIDPGSGSLILAALLRVLCAIVDRIIGHERIRSRRWGRRVRIFFPKPLRLDLWVESRVRTIQLDDPFGASFYWPRISEDIIQKLFEGTLRSDLLRLRATQHILITNEWLQCGPLPQSKAASAEVLDSAAQLVQGLIEAAKELQPTPSELDEKTEPTDIMREKRMLAIGIAFLVPGGGHFYVRRPWTAAVLAFCWLYGFFLVWSDMLIGAILVGGAMVFDIIGSELAIGKKRKGKMVKPLQQTLIGIGMGIILLCLAWIVKHMLT